MKKLEKIKEKLAGRGLDGILITSPENHRYSCGFHNPDGQILITKNKSYVLADFRYIEAAKRESDTEYEVIMPTADLPETIRKYTEENDVKKLGFEESSLNYKQFEEISRILTNCEMVPAEQIMSELRIIKTPDEIEKIVKAQRIAEKSFEELLTHLSADITEREAAAELEYLMKKNGAEGISFETIAVSGSASSSPHGVPRDKKLEKGFLTFDFGALIDGYHSDMTRTIVIGKADEDMKKVYNTVLKAQLAVLDVISFGKSNFEMDKISRDIIYKAGYEGCYGHSLGHGVGLLIHESPNMSPKTAPNVTLEEGNVVTVEPGIYIEGKYGCRIEDMVYITKEKAVNLTQCPKELIELSL